MKFPYIRYRCDPSDLYPRDSVLLPHVPIKLIKDELVTAEMNALVDSGADLSLFNYDVAAFFGMDPESGIPHNIAGLGGICMTYVHDGFAIEVGGFRFPLRIAFSKDAPRMFGILGREGFFGRYKVIVDENKHTVELKEP